MSVFSSFFIGFSININRVQKKPEIDKYLKFKQQQQQLQQQQQKKSNLSITRDFPRRFEPPPHRNSGIEFKNLYFSTISIQFSLEISNRISIEFDEILYRYTISLSTLFDLPWTRFEIPFISLYFPKITFRRKLLLCPKLPLHP